MVLTENVMYETGLPAVNVHTVPTIAPGDVSH